MTRPAKSYPRASARSTSNVPVSAVGAVVATIPQPTVTTGVRAVADAEGHTRKAGDPALHAWSPAFAFLFPRGLRVGGGCPRRVPKQEVLGSWVPASMSPGGGQGGPQPLPDGPGD
jgi:hypothetical protein